MANVGEVLAALGSVAGAVDRAVSCLGHAQTDFSCATAVLAETLAGHSDSQAGDAVAGMTVAVTRVEEAVTLLSEITARLDAFVERIRGADGTSVPPGARAARAPVAGRVHPTHIPTPAVQDRDYVWAAQVGTQLTEWREGKSTEALVFDTDGQDWQVNSGVDAELSAAAKAVVKDMIFNGEVGTSADAIANHGERTGLRLAVTHAETKAAVWAAVNGKQFVDVVTNRDYVCGEQYQPGDRYRPPGCLQAVAAILPTGCSMRIWRRGLATPLVITGRGRKG